MDTSQGTYNMEPFIIEKVTKTKNESIRVRTSIGDFVLRIGQGGIECLNCKGFGVDSTFVLKDCDNGETKITDWLYDYYEDERNFPLEVRDMLFNQLGLKKTPIRCVVFAMTLPYGGELTIFAYSNDVHKSNHVSLALDRINGSRQVLIEKTM